MTATACIELKDLELQTQIGSYGSVKIIPKQHLLDLILWIDPKWALIFEDKMENVFDYDPLVAEINTLGRECHYETQERLITRIIQACSSYSEIKSVDICLRKLPVNAESGSLGVRVSIDPKTFSDFRKNTNLA